MITFPSLSHRLVLVAAACSLALLSAAPSSMGGPPSGAADRADHWPHWRGPLANGLAPQASPPVRWTAKENIRWKTPLPGEGHATPIVWGDSIFLVSARPTPEEASSPPNGNPEAKTAAPGKIYEFLVICLDRRTGQEKWRRVACREAPHEGRHPTNSYASASPVTDGRRLYVSFGSRGIYCYSLDGQLLWQRDLGDMHTRYGWGEGASPAVQDNTLVVNWDHEGQSFITALDTATGKTKWKVDRDEPTSWATPLIVRHRGRHQVIVNGTNRARSYDLNTGKVVWECGGQTVNAIPSPVARDGIAYCMSGYRGAMAVAVSLDARGDLDRSAPASDLGKMLRWRYTRATPYVPSPILIDNQLYFTRGNTGILTSLDIESGSPIIREERLPEIRSMYASPAAADGRIYFVGRDGTTVVLRHGRTLEVLAINRIGEPVDASPVLIGDQLLLRSASHLYCIEEPATDPRAQPPPGQDTPVSRALEFMSREVAQWPRENRCYSCHNNGDAARVLFIANRLGYDVDPAALRETLDWLAAPGQWEHNGGEGEFNDKKLATLQFSAALAEALRAGLLSNRDTLKTAASMVARLRSPAGIWQMNAPGTIGSPVNYCDALATAVAVEILAESQLAEAKGIIGDARKWLRAKQPRNVVTAASLLFALADSSDANDVEQQQRCLKLIARAQHDSGGWGPFVDAAPEPYDTALVLIALARLPASPQGRAMVERGRLFLERTQEQDGSWAETTRPPNGVSYAQRMSTTAWCTHALLVTGVAQGGGAE